MAEEQHEWNRQEGEPAIWYRRFERYLLLFPRRSVAAVFQEEIGQSEENRGKPRKSDPPGHWYEYANNWQWEQRAQAYDDAQFAEEEKEARRVRRSGFALQHKRILALQSIVDGLIAHVSENDKVWLPDVKAVGTGPDAERVDLVQFNDALFKEIREYLTDISEEVGGRVKKTETAITNLPKEYIGMVDDDGVEM